MYTHYLYWVIINKYSLGNMADFIYDCVHLFLYSFNIFVCFCNHTRTIKIRWKTKKELYNRVGMLQLHLFICLTIKCDLNFVDERKWKRKKIENFFVFFCLFLWIRIIIVMFCFTFNAILNERGKVRCLIQNKLIKFK